MALKPLWIIGAVLTFAGLTTYLIRPAHSSEEVLGQAQQIAELHQTISNLQARNHQLEQELQSLRKQPVNRSGTVAVVAASEQRTAQTAASTPTSPPQVNAAQVDAVALLNTERLRHKNEEYDLWVKNALQNGAQPAALMRARYEQEAVDNQWAPRQEQKILDLFSSHEDLRGTAVKSAKCRTTQCEISLATNSPEQSFQQFEKANKAFQSQSPGNFVTFATNMETNTATIYLSTEAPEANR